MSTPEMREYKRLWARKNAHKMKAWREAHPEKVKEYARKHYAENKATIVARSAVWAKANPEKMKAAIRAWNRANAETLRQHCNDRYARSKGALGSFTVDEWLAIVAAQNGRCFDCDQERKLTRGHLMPLSKGGSNGASNIVGQCQPCNSRQGRSPHPSLKVAS